MSANTSEQIWTRWIPTDDQPWNVRRVVHLHRRVAFAANWTTIERDLKEGPHAAIQRLLNPNVGANLMDHPGTLLFLAPTDPSFCDPSGPAYQIGIRWSSGLGTDNDMLTGMMNYWDTRFDPDLHQAAGTPVCSASACSTPPICPFRAA